MAKNKIKQVTEKEPSTDQIAPEERIGSRIRAARETRGLSQTALSTRSKMNDPKGQGISRTVLVGYEAGHSKPGAREIRLLCETLAVTPNWLIFGSEENFTSSQASLEIFRNRNDLISAIRLALALCVLRPHEREAFTSLILSMAGREMGDLRLSALFGLASMMGDPILEQIKEGLPEDFSAREPIEQTLEKMVKHFSEGANTNIGNKLIFNEDGEPVAGEWLYSPPKK